MMMIIMIFCFSTFFYHFYHNLCYYHRFHDTPIITINHLKFPLLFCFLKRLFLLYYWSFSGYPVFDIAIMIISSKKTILQFKLESFLFLIKNSIKMGNYKKIKPTPYQNRCIIIVIIIMYEFIFSLTCLKIFFVIIIIITIVITILFFINWKLYI